MLNIIKQFRNTMIAAGMTPPNEIIVDGKKHRFSTNGKAKDEAGEYRIYPDNIPGGYFKDFRTGAYYTFHLDMGRPYTTEENVAFKEAVIRREQEEQDEEEAAAQKAQKQWAEALPANADHPYLAAKGIEPGMLRIDKNDKDKLLIPVILDKKIRSLQEIKPGIDKSFEKRFTFNSRIAGCYYCIGKPEGIICICEGVATGFSIHKATGYAVVIAFSCWNLSAVSLHVRSKLPKASILLCSDNDARGLEEATKAAKLINGKVVLPVFDERRTEKDKDFNDMAKLYGLDKVKDIINAACLVTNNGDSNPILGPIPLPDPLPPVMLFDPKMLPEALRNFVMDVSKRVNGPPDFVAVTALCALSAVLGRTVLIRPKQYDDWTVTPNLWGAIIGRPSAKKSPTMKAALQPLYMIENTFSKQYEDEKQKHAAKVKISELDVDAAKKSAKEKYNNEDRNGALIILENSISTVPPLIRNRLVVNDATVEKLGELLNENPNGLILVRDELFGWLSEMQKEEKQSERTFYLECFDGNSRYTYDRIGRGTKEILNCTLSIIGGIQPGRLSSLIRKAISGVIDDGLIQRLQLAVWPDDIKDYTWVDQAPDAKAYEQYIQTFRDFQNLQNSDLPDFLRFTPEAQHLFIEWDAEIQTIARSEDIHFVLASHLLKMPQTIASLALIFELINGGRTAIGLDAMVMALEWADYLKSHAERLYSLGGNSGIEGAHTILQRRDKLQLPFKARELKLKNWKGLSSMGSVTKALQCLIDHGYLCTKKVPTTDSGGRATVEYSWIDYQGGQ